MFEPKSNASKRASKAESSSSSKSRSDVKQRLSFVDNRVQFASDVVQRVNYDDKPWCTSRLVSTTTTFDKRYYRKVQSHIEETAFLQAAVAAANAVTGHASQTDYTETRGHVSGEPGNASLI